MPIITDKMLLKRWNQFYGNNLVTKFQYYNKSGINSYIRLNSLKIDNVTLETRLKKKGLVLEKSSLENTYHVKKYKISLGATNEFLLGYYAIQGLVSQFVSHVISPNSNERILDMSAAPGGKTAHLSALMNNSGLIVAIDKSKKRLTALRSNLSRLGVRNVLCFEGRSEEIVPKLGQFDKILLDAPCSGSGSICRTPNKSWTKKESDITRLSNLQEKLLETGLKALKINGELIYSTCSIEPEESEIQIINILNKYDDNIDIIKLRRIPEFKEKIDLNLEIDDSSNINSLNNKWIRLLPNQDYEGFFICKFIKRGKLN